MTNQNFLNSNYTNTLKIKIEVFDQSQNVFFNTCFDKNQLKNLTAWFLEKYGEKVTVDFLETLKQVGFHQATLAGVSLGVDDLEIPSQKSLLLSQALVKIGELTNESKTGNITSVEKSQRLIDTWNQTSEILRQTAVQNFRLTNPVNPVFMMAFSGARGNISQVRQLVAMRGLMADPQGAILEFPIQSNFREGLTITEYLISCYGARKGLVDTALRTATSGYLTRRLVDAVQHVVVVMTDCKTKRGILIKNKNLEQRLPGRVLLEDLVLNSTTVIEKNTLISQSLAKLLALNYQEIYVRSPLTCNTEKSVCQLCYGLNLAQGKLVSIGEAVGVIAAQSIGEPGTQLTMRTFHTGGVGVFSDQAMKSFNAPFDGKIEFLENLPGLFVRTPHGNIVYLLKYSENAFTKPILRLKSVNAILSKKETGPFPKKRVGPFPKKQVFLDQEFFGKGKDQVYEIPQSNVPSGSILWVKQGEYVKAGQLLVQASQIKTSKQQMPESSHPVQAPYSGEVFFESMVIRVIRKQTQLKAKKLIKKEDEISPKFRTLTELGNFWVFSSSVQKEYSISKSFFAKGDLVSSDTPILQYNLNTPKKAQLKLVNSSLVLGQNCFEFLLSKSYYCKLFYFLIKTDSQNQNTVIAYNNNQKKGLLTWYPCSKYFNVRQSGYCSIISNGSDLVSQKGPDLTDGTINDLVPQKRYVSNQVSLFWSEHQVFHFKNLNMSISKKTGWSFPKKRVFLDQDFFGKGKGKQTSCFLVNNSPLVFSKKGTFQIEFHEKIKWSKKTVFPSKLLKNLPHIPFPKNSFLGPNSWSKKTRWSQKDLAQKNVFFWKGEGKGPQISSSNFLKKALKFSQSSLFTNSKTHLIQKKQGWFYVPEKEITEFVPSQLNSILLEPGKKFEKISFLNSFVSFNFLQTQNLVFLKSKVTKKHRFNFCSPETILDSKNNFSNKKSFFLSEEKVIKSKTKLLIFTKQFSNQFCFYKMKVQKNSWSQKDLVQKNAFFWKGKGKDSKFKINPITFKIKRKRQLVNVLFLQKNSQQFIPDIQFFKQNWFLQKTLPTCFFTKSPLFTKQFSTHFEEKRLPRSYFNVVTPCFSEWFSAQNLLKIEIKVKSEASNSQKSAQKFKSNFQLYSPKSNISFTGFSFMFYNVLKLKNSKQFSFKTFDDGLVLPEFKITQAFIKSKKLGEFRHLQINQNSNSFSVLRNTDIITLKLPLNNFKTKWLKIGAIVRWGQEIFPGFAVPVSGQILKITAKTLTIRKGIPILASARGVVHVFNNDLIQKHDLLITLKSRRLQTEDIVQGIPKIEQLFEARETQGGEIIPNSAHTKLQSFFRIAIQSKPLRVAVNQSIHQIQLFLVENILEAYSNQGVKISEKHVEIVVRQMTARVRILSGGDTGLLPGEIVQLKWVERVNTRLARLGSRQASYEPMILGITKSVLQSESFLVAASFQEVSRVLVRSALTKKTDFLRGLHENVILGQLIPAGTGVISRNAFDDTSPSSLEKSESNEHE